ncbi:translocation/assembly module TamB domain-containing protein [Psychromonas ossibalaenae]|uniref:translocation/assembly module TamB domain-containing protein n=1 Tax=Psychromonas ossibalaenae TaxID=444922 RepID=UPI00035C8A65|nr:translocation/assembly module TamB domain-containing protein [Psychromonas ossibalaenae]
MSFKSTLTAVCKFTIITSISLLTVLLLTISLLLFSHSGNNLVFNAAEKFEPRFSIELQSGSIFNSPVFADIIWNDGETSIAIESASYVFDWSCLFNKLCLEQLDISGADINIAAANSTSEPSETQTNSEIQLPVEVELKAINLSDINFALGGLSLELQNLSLQAHGLNKDISINSAVKGLTVYLPEAGKEPQAGPSSDKLHSIPAILKAGSLPEIVMPLNLYINPITVSRFKLIQGEQTLFELNSLDTQFNFINSKLSIDSLALDIPETDLNLAGDIDFTDRYPLNIELNGKLKSIAQLQPASLLSGQLYHLKSSGDLAQLSTALSLSNKVSMQLQTQVNLFAENLPHKLDLHWQNLTWPLTKNELYSSKQGRLQSTGSADNYQLKLDSDYQIDNVPPGDLSLSAQGSLQELNLQQLIVHTLDGSVNLSGLLNWQDSLKWRGQLSLDAVDLKQLKTEYTGNFSGLIKQDVTLELKDDSAPLWAFSVPEMDVNGTFLEQPFSLSGQLSGDHKSGVLFNDFVVHNADNKFNINGRYDQQSDLNIALNIADLGHALLDSHGSINGNVAVKGPIDKLRVKAQLEGNEVSYQTTSLQHFKLSTDSVISAQPQVSLDVNAGEIVVNDQLIQSAAVRVRNTSRTDTQVHDVDLSIDSELLSTDLQVKLTQEKEKWLTALSTAVIDISGQRLTLSTPFDVIAENNQITLTEHCWNTSNKVSAKNGKLCINKFTAGDYGDISFDIDSYLLTSLDPLMPAELKLGGAVSANADIKWLKEQKPSFDIDVFSKDMAVKVNLEKSAQGQVIYPVQSFEISLKGDKQQTDLSAVIFSDKLIDTKIQGKVWPYKTQPDIKASVNIDIPDFSPFAALIPQLEKLTGSLHSELAVSGRMANPIVNGLINFNDMRITAVGSPVQINRLNTQITVHDTRADINGSFYTGDSQQTENSKPAKQIVNSALGIINSSLNVVGIKSKQQKLAEEQAKTAAGETDIGKAFIKGQFDWKRKFKGSLHFFANKLEIYDYEKIDLLISPDLKLVIDDYIELKGKVLVNQGRITVKDLPEGAVTPSKDVVVVDIEEPQDATTLPINIDLEVDLGSKLQVVAMGLDTYVNGNMMIAKEPKKSLTINGELNFVDGSYRSLGQQLVLQKSRVIFQGAPDSPYISIEAIRDPNNIEDNVTAGVRVTGTPDQLKLVIFSDPSMSQQDALSYITRGKSLDATSDDDSSSNQLASMLVSIGAGQSEDLMTNLGNTVGIKDLSLSSSGSGDQQSVGVSGYIAPGIQLSYGVGVFDSFTVLAIRYELFERFYIEASNGIYQAVDAYYQFDWD